MRQQPISPYKVCKSKSTYKLISHSVVEEGRGGVSGKGDPIKCIYIDDYIMPADSSREVLQWHCDTRAAVGVFS